MLSTNVKQKIAVCQLHVYSDIFIQNYEMCILDYVTDYVLRIPFGVFVVDNFAAFFHFVCSVTLHVYILSSCQRIQINILIFSYNFRKILLILWLLEKLNVDI